MKFWDKMKQKAAEYEQLKKENEALQKKIAVKEILKKFDFHVVNKGKPNSRYITSSGIGRIGIELSTKIKPAYRKQTNPVCFGTSELNYFKQSTPKQYKQLMKQIKNSFKYQ